MEAKLKIAATGCSGSAFNELWSNHRNVLTNAVPDVLVESHIRSGASVGWARRMSAKVTALHT